MKEKYVAEFTSSEVKFEENKLLSFQKRSTLTTSYRVHRDDKVGIHCQVGEISEEEGFAIAEENLKERPRPYPFELETGKRSRDKTEKQFTDRELLELAKECMEYLCEKYPRFVFSANFVQSKRTDTCINDKGMEYSNTDCAVNANITFKHVESKDISDGGFGMGSRSFDKETFCRMADNYLANYEVEVELPEEIIIDMQYYSLVGILTAGLNGENLALGTSLLTGKVGEKVFSEDFSFTNDVSDEECWFDPFWDGDGCVTEGDKRTFVDKGVIVSGYADKRTAEKYHVPHTGNGSISFSDIPDPALANVRIVRSEKTVKELLKGRLCVIPVSYCGGGFADNGDYTMPIQCAMLSDGEKILGKLPPFTMVSSMFDMFGKDFIGVGADNPIFNDKQILFKAKKGNIV